MKQIFKEPLVHFLMLGAILFGIGLIRGEAATPSSTRIAITPGVIERLVEGFRATWRRPPTESEFAGLVEDYLKEEVMYREAVVMGLDQGDQIIRRRLRQKVEFLTADLVGTVQPTDEEMSAFFGEHREDYRRDVRFRFVHVFFRTDGAEGEDTVARRRRQGLHRFSG